MSWLFSRELAEGCLRHISLNGEPSALWNWINIADAYSSSDKMKENLDPVTQYGMTFVPLTEDRGAGQLMSYLEGFLAKHSALRPQGTIPPTIFGRKCVESWQMSLPGTYLPRTSPGEPLTPQPTTSRRWGTRRAAWPFQRQTWVVTTYGADIGYVHTPTATANYAAKSMQKWPSCRAFVRVFGKPTPTNHEWLMTWPRGWTALQPVATDRWLAWLQRRGF